MKYSTYDELRAEIANYNEDIKKVNEDISLADNEYELAQLAMTLDFYEKALLVAEEVMYDTIDKGRGD